MADDEFNLDDPGSEGGSEASLDDFFQPTGGKGDDAAGGSGGEPVIDDFFAPPADEPKAKPAKPGKPAMSDLPIEKSRLDEFPEEPADAEPMATFEPAAPDQDMEITPLEASAAEKKGFFARAWIFLVLLLVLILAAGAVFMAYTKFFGAKEEVVAAAPAPKPKPKPKPKPAVAPAPETATGNTAPAPATGATVVKPGAAAPAKPAAGGAEIETEEETPAVPASKPGKPEKPGKPATAAVETEPETAEPAPKPGKPGKPAPVAVAPAPPKPLPVTTAKPGNPAVAPAPKPAPSVAPKPAPAPPKPLAVATAKPGKPAVAPAPKPAPSVAPKPAPAPPKPVAVATAKPGKPAVAPAPKPAPMVAPKPAPPKPLAAAPKPGSRPVPPKTAPAPRPAVSSGPWYVQVGSYMLESSKTQPEQQLGALGFLSYHYTPESRRLRIHHVMVGKNLGPDQVRQVTADLQAMGYATEPGLGGSVIAYSYGNVAIARATRAKLVKAGFKQVTIKSETKTVRLDQLRVGGYASRAQAAKALSELRRGGFRGALIIKE